MKIIRKQLYNLEWNYPFEQVCPAGKAVFMDIETTGFVARSSRVYLIGCIVREENCFTAYQWFSENNDDEVNILRSFADFVKDDAFIVHFNGNHFDIPYLDEKFVQYGIDCCLSRHDGLDLYRRIAPYKSFLKLPNCKQKTIETYLGILRRDVLAGDELIGVYLHYVSEPNEYDRDLLLLHNLEDIEGLVQILPILAYVDLFNRPFTVTKVQANYYNDFSGSPDQELVMKIKLDTPLPIQVTEQANRCLFTGLDTSCTIKVPIYSGELKYFYSNYKEYYYLPEEDVALHKAVAAYVDPAHRVPATAATCYTRKCSEYLPEWSPVLEPFFKKEYNSRESYFELTEEIKQDRELFTRYAEHILQMIINNI